MFDSGRQNDKVTLQMVLEEEKVNKRGKDGAIAYIFCTKGTKGCEEEHFMAWKATKKNKVGAVDRLKKRVLLRPGEQGAKPEID
jgi:hypothetical protein